MAKAPVPPPSRPSPTPGPPLRIVDRGHACRLGPTRGVQPSVWPILSLELTSALGHLPLSVLTNPCPSLSVLSPDALAPGPPLP